MTRSTLYRRCKAGLALVIAYFAIQSVVEVAHEFAHSGSAWLLGYTSTPFTVIWGNPITTKGWDEGVPYDRLFPSPGNPAEAAIGGMPLLMHLILLLICLYALTRPVARSGRVSFFGFYLLAVMNLAELIAYIIMRPFIPDGDTGRFNEGLAISPWPLFVAGTAFLLWALWLFAIRIGPKIDRMTDGSRLEHRAVTWFAGFIMFLWTSGIRMLSLYPDPQWKSGLIGIAAFLAWIALDWHLVAPDGRSAIEAA
jgi:hypothetical protein